MLFSTIAEIEGLRVDPESVSMLKLMSSPRYLRGLGLISQKRQADQKKAIQASQEDKD